MNCPSRTDETNENQGWNQNPSGLTADLTKRQDLDGRANSRAQRDHGPGTTELAEIDYNRVVEPPGMVEKGYEQDRKPYKITQCSIGNQLDESMASPHPLPYTHDNGTNWIKSVVGFLRRSGQVLLKYSRFIGPGFMISVAYIDPGNYSTDVAAGASTKFALLFIVLMSNIFAIFLQSLCVKLGTVTGLNLAEHCKAHLPKWLNIVLYVFGESAIIATDIAEVRTLNL